MVPGFYRAGLLCATALMGVTGAPALAQDAPQDSSSSSDTNEIIVTGSRRTTTLQDAPMNISAVSAATIESQRLDDIRSLASFTPGVTVADTGPASTGGIILRGIASGDTSVFGANSGNSVGVYLGEVPLYLDFKLIDVERVEVLQGPQGTLYGLGTLAGAVRYIPNRPDTNNFTVDVHGRGYAQSHSDEFGGVGDVAVNVPIIKDHVAFRTSTGYYDNAGFIDYNYLLQRPGVSNPQPGRATATSTGSLGTTDDYAANFRRREDVNYEHTFTTRNQLLLEVNPAIKAYLTYAHQTTKTGGRQANGSGVLGTGKYEAPFRYLEPVDRSADLFSAEFNIGLGNIAQLVSTTAYTKQHIESVDDNTDLLLDLDYGYEAFPAFSSYANNERRYKQFNQEVRLVSTHGGPVSWVVGGFYNRLKYASDRLEYTPGFSNFAGLGRTDDLEYISKLNSKTVEKALYGEASLHLTDQWQVTGGIRYFKYDATVVGGSALPLIGVGIGAYPSTTINANRFKPGSTGKDGIVWKANTSYKFSDDLLAYFTYSTGYRVGGANQVIACTQADLDRAASGGQVLCALPNELFYGPDRTRNLELGVRASLFDKRLQLTVDGYRVKWSGVQVPSQTLNGAIGITVNGAEAVSQGFDFQGTLKITPKLSLIGTYSYVDAHLTRDAAGLVVSQGVRDDAFDGDRLPGSAKNSGSAQLIYTQPLGDGRKVQATVASVYRGNIYSRVGLRGNGEAIPHYTTQSASLNYITRQFEVGVFADNIFDKYAVTAISNDRSSYNQVRSDVVERYYSRGVLTPRRVGVEFRLHY
ncbi:TonB-dependent receptor [Sphingomonas ginsenosidivorax]|uniref:TonB-dependent receptor n=1 Tax=Sphingomonas ginsenosidivorax TaxID=862135 RepID=A0A5C6UG95_9SPHN|nr:TonB-dependent receptor [Sphingomonas ginsenosidivorax]TXC71065.1 TonB-dependent receptor [Sphingomonas ginsenosidivorax]